MIFVPYESLLTRGRVRQLRPYPAITRWRMVSFVAPVAKGRLTRIDEPLRVTSTAETILLHAR